MAFKSKYGKFTGKHGDTFSFGKKRTTFWNKKKKKRGWISGNWFQLGGDIYKK